jgi:transglutaminase-like putative cysteine protease
LSCPHCDLPFEVLAVDTRGRIRRAMEFLGGFDLPVSPGDQPAKDEEKILALWRTVADRCEYELDQDRADDRGDGNREVWKTPAETWAEASGDCEDTAILLADVLIESGFEARVAIGWNGNIGQHAWVVVKAGDRQYLLETTLQKEIGREDLAEVAASAPFYQPEQLFDRERIYFSTARPERFTKDYFANEVWKPVPPSGSRVLTQR